MASLRVLPERLLHKRLPRWAQPLRWHHQRGTGLRERSKCVSCKAPEPLCKEHCKEDMPELRKSDVGFRDCPCRVYVSLLAGSLEERVRSSNEM